MAAIGATLGEELVALVDHVLQSSALCGSQLLTHGTRVAILIGLDRSHVNTQLVLDEVLIGRNDAKDTD